MWNAHHQLFGEGYSPLVEDEQNDPSGNSNVPKNWEHLNNVTEVTQVYVWISAFVNHCKFIWSHIKGFPFKSYIKQLLMQKLIILYWMCVTVSDWWKFNRAKRRFGEEIQTKN